MKAKIKLLKDNAKVPTQGSKYAAAFDLYACLDEEVDLLPGETSMVGTGVSITPPEGMYGAIYARSGLASKHGIRPANCVGICDEDYTGEYIVALYNDSDSVYTVRNGERIAQLIFAPYYAVEFEVVDELESTERGSGGFGHTGK